MGWVTLIGTLSGAVLGVGSSMLIEGIRARRDRGNRLEEVRREAYVKFLTALTETETALQTLALSRPTPVDPGDVITAYRSQRILPTYYELLMVAPPVVSEAAENAYQGMRGIRDGITTLATVERGSDPWQEVHLPYRHAVRRLRQVMRDSIQGGAPTGAR